MYGNFEDEKIKEIIEELEESESGGEMSTIAERLEREYKNRCWHKNNLSSNSLEVYFKLLELSM